jgi:hypothetical protein
MDIFAMAVGYAFLAAIVGGSVVFAMWAVVTWFPLCFQWTIKPPSYIKTPNQVQNIDALIGVCNRGGDRMWFIGFMAVSPGREPEIVARQP